jgi:tetratricopeptide (TPR) repeat protein
MFAMTATYRGGFAAAIVGDTASASRVAARFRALDDSVRPRRPTFSAVGAREIEAVIAMKRGDVEGAIKLLQEASAMEDKFQFAGPPMILIAHELLGDALVAAKRPAEAEVAYEQELKLTPNRSGALLGLARARAARSDSTGAAEAARRLLANWHGADADLAALGEVRRIAALSQAK